jgi:hypothetical protein
MEGCCLVLVHTSEIAELEEYLLSFVLRWRLVYNTPYDYIHTLAYYLYSEYEKPLIITKAIHISELFLMCINVV